MNRKLLNALRALAGQIAAGPLVARLECVIDAETNAAVSAVADELGGRNKRSAAVRTLIKRGAQGMLDDARTGA